MEQKIIEMIDLQNRLNINTNGADWAVSRKTLQGRIINWYRSIYMEAAEAVDSLNWKHWKDINAEDDMENVKIELVDIWHFIMSAEIESMGIDKAIESIIEKYNFFIKIFNTEENKLIDMLELIIKKAINDENPIVEFFRTVHNTPDFSLDDVYKLYIGKNCLNQFRQDNGYKDGLYKKIWDGKEDNVYMQEILNSEPNIGYDELYERLSEKYKTLL